MSLNETPSGERIHIGFYGLRNAGKSSLVNAVTGQELSIVSDVKGTTTDPVKKAMELLPIGPVVIIDTPGTDDAGTLGGMRVQRALDTLSHVDIAVLVLDAAAGKRDDDEELIKAFEKKHIPYITAYTKADKINNRYDIRANEIYVSSKTGENINELKEMLGRLAVGTGKEKKIVSDLISPLDTVVLVTPIDSAAPKGRLILPQQQTLRDILDTGAIPVVTRETELEAALNCLRTPPCLVITDSQAFGYVNNILPPDVPLTSFSILFARYKGALDGALEGAAQLDNLHDGDRVLISEGCTHHRQCGDIGTEKLPRMIRAYTGVQPIFEFTSGADFPRSPEDYTLVVHCGGCMLNEKEMSSRRERCTERGVPMTNYGIALAKMNGILARAVKPLGYTV